jgi:hypothetical protein
VACRGPLLNVPPLLNVAAAGLDAIAPAACRSLCCRRGSLVRRELGEWLTWLGHAPMLSRSCRDAGADPALVPGWIAEGRRRAETALMPPQGTV